MKRIFPLVLASLIQFSLTVLQGRGDSLDPQEIIEKFVARESEFQQEWQNYTYTQYIRFEVLNDYGQAVERREMKAEVYFTSDGRRETRILWDRGGLRSVGVTKEDLDDAFNLQPFALTRDRADQYEIRFRGKERVDELDTYVFEVKPRRIESGERYFQGRVWVDDIDYQIVRTVGRALPETRNNKFPEFETLRQQVDGKYWFPVWTEADDVLSFGSFLSRRQVRIRQLITYDNFQRFDVDTTIRFGDVLTPEEPDEP